MMSKKGIIKILRTEIKIFLYTDIHQKAFDVTSVRGHKFLQKKLTNSLLCETYMKQFK